MRNLSRLLPAGKKKLVVSSIGVLTLVIFSSLLLFEVTKAEVTLTTNGEQQTVKTHANTVEELLHDEGITVTEHDALSVGLDASITNGMKINYEQAKKVYAVIDDQQPKTYYTHQDTVAGFIKETKLASDHDDVSLPGDTKVKDELHLAITTGYQITIDNGGKKKKVWTTGGKVKDILVHNDVSFAEKSDDKIKPALNKEVTKGTAITITRVEKKTDVEKESIDYDTKTIEKSTLAKGDKQVIDEGEEGIVEKEYAIVKENGKEVSRKLIRNETVKPSKDKVVAIGTKETKPASVQTQTLAYHGESKSGKKVLYMSATAFTADCSGCSGHTATGINLKANPNAKVIAVDPSVIPLGSRVWVEGYGVAIAGDTGGFSGNTIDVHVPNKQAAYRFGRRQVKVKILN